MIELDSIIIQLDEYFESGDVKALKIIALTMNPNDIAYISSHIHESFREEFLRIIIGHSDLSNIIGELNAPLLTQLFTLLKEVSPEKVADLFSGADADDTALILSKLDEEMKEWVMSEMRRDDVKETQVLLKYPEYSAGRIMSPNYFAVNPSDTVSSILQSLKQAIKAEMIYYLYVVNHQNVLIGVASLRDILFQPREKAIQEIMTQDVKYVSTFTDQEEVVKFVERYNVSAIPVVNETKKLVGLVTVDDVIDIIRYEATEDIMRLAGITEKEFFLSTPWKNFISRVPWLMVAFFGGILTVQSMSFFAGKIPSITLLAFIPVIVGMGGNIGTQSSTIIVRGLATGNILASRLWHVLWKELLTGVLLGCFFGVLLLLLAEIQFIEIPYIGLIVGLGIFFSMLVAALIGTILPMLFQKLKVDPAIATGPFVSTTIDNLGILGYLTSILLVYHFFL